MADAIHPKTMRAWRYTSRGLPTDVLKLDSGLPTPAPTDLRPTEVLIKVTHVSLNGGVIVAFTLIPHISLPFFWRTPEPRVPELEFSGRVVATGSAVSSSDLNVDDEVFGHASLLRGILGSGTLAEYYVAGAHQCLRKPFNASLEGASGLVGVGCTAVQAVELAGLKRGDKVLVNGGSGGLGSMLVQVVRSAIGDTGVLVSTCSAANVEMVEDLGADEVIDYRAHDPLHTYLSAHPIHSQTRFNYIIDSVGTQDLFIHSPAYLAENGLYLNLGGLSVTPSVIGMLAFFVTQNFNRFCPVLLGGTPRAYRFYSAKPSKPTMEKVKRLYEAGKVKAVIDSVWEMKDALKANEILLSHRARGKIVIKVQQD